MIRYEVNIVLEHSIETEYLKWLKPHINEMLTYKGFKNAKLLKDSEKRGHYTVHYDIETMNDFDDYVKNHSAKMRNEATKLFGEKFSASRRIFEIISDSF